MFERFQQDARDTLARAKTEAAKAGKTEVGTRHLLIALLTGSDQTAETLAAAGADPAELRAVTVPAPGADTAAGVSPAETPAATLASVEDGVLAGVAAPIAEAAPAADPVPAAVPAVAARPVAAEAVASGDVATAGDEAAGDEIAEVAAGIPLTNDARTALERAKGIAQRLKHQRISTGHVLLGIIDEPGNSGHGALKVAGIHVGTLRADLLRQMEAEAEATGQHAGVSYTLNRANRRNSDD